MATLIAPRQEKARQTKERIFRAAVRILTEYGEEYLTTKNICTEAGVSNGTFFYHFKSKDDLLGYYVQEGYENYVTENPYEASDEDGDFIEQSIKVYKSYLEYCASIGVGFVSLVYKPSNKSLSNNLPNSNGGMTIVYRETLEIYTRAIQKGMIDTSFSPERCADDACCITKGCVFEWCLHDGNTSISEMAERILRAYLIGISTSEYRDQYLEVAQ